MRSKGLLALAILSVSILSYGFNGSAFAEQHNIPPISASTELPSYENGDRVELTGSLRDYDTDLHAGLALTFVIKSPDGNLVTIGQLNPKSDGSFSHSFVAGGPLWKLSGDYVIEFSFGPQDGELEIVYTGGEFEKPQPPQPDEPPVTCGPDQNLVDGECMDKEPPPPPTCGPDQTLVNGNCVDEEPECGPGTELVNGVCQIIAQPDPDDGGGACLIATAAFGSELAPQVQFLREVRDNTVMGTSSGAAFMTGFNQFYYSFSPTIADWERQNPMFQETVRAFITPMISTLSIMTLADNGSEVEVLAAGISVIMLNLGMYIAAPALIGFKLHKHLKTRK